ncbi:MAG TPA: hypothetical protein VMU17_02000 [Elusimicrobiota bacterium]|nr:hypothetical protein [Elusimicrobiota bacterium]
MTYDEACERFAAWILADKKRRRPDSLYCVGITGTIGRGKTVFSQKIIEALNRRRIGPPLRALARSLDDYYLPRAARYKPEFLARGYNPPGISNRGPAGTHDVELLRRTMRDLEAWLADRAAPHPGVDIPSFDKQADDRSTQPFHLDRRIDIFVLEGWFIGAAAPRDSMPIPPGLKRSVAIALADYQPIFERLDALWAFDPVSMDEIIRQRQDQQLTLNRQTGRLGMAPGQIERFVRYFYEDSWARPWTSPEPPAERVSFWASMDGSRRLVETRAGPRAFD